MRSKWTIPMVFAVFTSITMACAQMPYFGASLQPTAAAVATLLVEAPVASGEEGQGQTLVELYQKVNPGAGPRRPGR